VGGKSRRDVPQRGWNVNAYRPYCADGSRDVITDLKLGVVGAFPRRVLINRQKGRPQADMIYRIVPSSVWHAQPDQPYAPATLAELGFIHCSPDEQTTLLVVNALYRASPRPLLVLTIDENRLTARCEWEVAIPEPPPGVPGDTRFPHVYGPINRDAVRQARLIQWGPDKSATGITA
jgi:uncharacterized protein (DUF952 family)